MRPLLLFLIFSWLGDAKNVFVSSPFDNFRIECPKKSGATELSVRMVESVGAKRQDIVFDMSCESIDELYPWVNIPMGIADMEREDCYYSPMFDPILDEQTEFSCKPREYFAGITRLTDTRIQVLCCRLRSRTEFNCRETVFNKPIGLSRSSIIESDNQLINAIKVSDRGYTIRFCDLAPRNIPDIYDDVKTTTERPKTTPKETLKVTKTVKQASNPSTIIVTRPTTAAPRPTQKISFIPDQIPENTDLQNINNIGNALPEYTPTKAPQLARINGAASVAATTESTTTTTTTEPTTTTTASTTTTTTTTTTTAAPTTTTTEPTTTTTTTTTPAPTTTTTEPTTTTTTTTEAVTEALPEEPEQEQQEETQPKAEETPVVEQTEKDSQQKPASDEKEKSVEDITMADDLSRVTFSNDDFPKANEKKLAVPGKMKFSKNQLPLRPGMSSDSDFLFLPHINHEGVRRAPVRTYRPHINLWSDEEDDMEEMYGRMGFSSVEKAQLRRKVTRAHRVPAESKENSEASKEHFEIMKNSIPDRESLFLKEDTVLPTARPDLPVTKSVAVLPEKVDNARFVDEETRSSPFDGERSSENSQSTRSPSVYDRDDLPEEDIEDVINRLSLRHGNIRRAPVRNTAPVEALGDKTERRAESDGKSRDGVRTVERYPIPMPELVVFDSKYKDREPLKIHDHLVPMMSSKFFGSDSKSTTTAPAVTSTTQATTTTTEYDPSKFYHTPRPKPQKKEKVLTFCTKEIAIRDERNMVIACGGELDVWTPSRCPQGTDCFVSSDSTYRICCPVSRG